MTLARRALSLLVSTGLVVGLAVISPPPAAAATVLTGVSLDSLGTDGTGSAQWPVALEPTYPLVLTTSGTTTTFRPQGTSGPVSSPYVSLTPADGASELTVGSWPTAKTAGVGLAGLTVNGNACDSTGTLTVHQVAYAQGMLSSLAATYQYRCTSNNGWSYGELRYRSSLGIPAAHAPVSFDLGSAPVGTATSPRILTVYNHGTVPLLMGTAALSGSSAWEFTVVFDGCGGATVPAGGTCTVAVQSVPSVRGPRTALLTVPDGTARGARVVTLTSTGFTTPSTPLAMSAVTASDGIAVDWNPPADNGGSILTGYQVFRGSSADDLALVATLDVTPRGHYSDRISGTTTPGTSYTYAVRAVNAAGAGAQSVTVQATTPASVFVPTTTSRVLLEPGPGVAPSGATVVLDGATGASIRTSALSWGQITAGGNVPGSPGVGVTLSPPTGSRFAPGTYDVLHDPDATHAGASVGLLGSYCFLTSGTLDVHAVAIDSDNVPQALAFELVFQCSYGPASRIVVRIGDDTPYTAVDVHDLAAGLVHVGTPTTVHSTFTNVGTEDVSVSGAVVSGAVGGTWSVSGGTCAGQVVAPQASCTTDLDVTPAGTGSTTATIRYDHSGGSSPTTRSLSAVGAAVPLEASAVSVTRAAGKVTLSWSDPGADYQKATTWEVWRGDAPDALSLLGTSSTTSFTDPDTSDSLRYYSLRGSNPAGAGPWHAQTVDATAVPPALGASALATSVVLDWTPSTTLPADPVTGYRVYRGTTPDDLVAVADTTGVRWTGPAPSKGQQVWYAVAALSGSTAGVRSPAVPVTGTGMQLVTTTDGAISGSAQLRSATDGRAVTIPWGAYKAFPEDVAVSPDGTRAAYVVEHRDYGYDDVVVGRTDGSGSVTTLVSDAKPKSDLAWSPDGKWLAFTSVTDDHLSSMLHLISAGGGPVYGITNSVGLFAPSWLDASTLVAADSSSASAPLVEIGVWSGTGTRTAIAGTEGASAPSVRPGGAEIAFVVPSGAADYESLRVLTVATGDVRAVSTPGSSYLGRPSWTPDGGFLYFVAGDSTTDVYEVGTGPGAVYRDVTNTATATETSVAVSVPDTVAPTDVVLSGVPAVTLGSSVVPQLSATDALTGVASYTLSYRRAPYNGSFGTVSTLTLTSPRAVAVARGYEYCFSLRATDLAGNTSAAVPEQCVVVPLDDRSLVRSSAFTALTGSAYYAGTAATAPTTGATLTRTGVTGAKQVYLVALTCRTCGSVDVLIGSVKVASVSLVSRRPAYRRVIALPAGAARTGTLTIRVTSSGRLVILDGVGLRQ